MAPLTVLFDLDGTLVDSEVGILEGFRRATGAVGLRPDEEAIRRWIGPPLEMSLLEVGVDPSDIPAAVAAYRSFYGAEGLYQATVYDGIEDSLDALRSAGATLAVTTAKLVDFAETIVAHFGLDRYFPVVRGAGSDGLVDKAHIVAGALADLGRPSPEHTALVGDRRYDMAAAAANGLRAVGVSWGYGSVQELQDAGAAVIVDKPSDLPAELLGS